MPEIIVKYKTQKSLKALEELSKYLNFVVVKKNPEIKNNKLLKEIETGLKQVKQIQEGKITRRSLKDILNEK